MALTTPELVELVTAEIGYWNTDVLAGWEAGMQGKRRVAGFLIERRAPEHLTGKRFSDWLLGRDAATRYREMNVRRSTVFTGSGPEGVVSVVRKGWVQRGPVITQLERKGVCGEVTVCYLENGRLKRTVACGI